MVFVLRVRGCGFASRLFAGLCFLLRVFVRGVAVVVAVLSCVCGWGCWVAFLLVSGSAGFSFGVAGVCVLVVGCLYRRFGVLSRLFVIDRYRG